MKELLSIFLSILGTILSLYIGIYLMLFGGINEIYLLVSSSMVDDEFLTISILKILFAIPITIFIWFISIVPMILQFFGKNLLFSLDLKE
jgi:ABC-type amino acid transport system permease subunit